MCNSSLANGWAWRKVQTLNRWVGKPRKRPKWWRCSSASQKNFTSALGSPKERSREICKQRQQLHHTEKVVAALLSGAAKGIRNTLKLNSWHEVHTHRHIFVLCLRLQLIQQSHVIWVTVGFGGPNRRVCETISLKHLKKHTTASCSKWQALGESTRNSQELSEKQNLKIKADKRSLELVISIS